MIKKKLTTIALMVFPFFINAQEHNHHNDHDHKDHEIHNHNGLELGLGAGAFYGFHEKEWAAGNHFHLMYFTGKLGYGIGGEAVYADVKHYSLGAIIAYRPIEALEFVVSPGILLENEETGKHLFSMHFEAIYSWELGDFGHIGPVVGYGFAADDSHALIGLHLGIGLN